MICEPGPFPSQSRIALKSQGAVWDCCGGSEDNTGMLVFKDYYKLLNGNPLQYSCLENPVDQGAWYVI